jgi:hypothetical protein
VRQRDQEVCSKQYDHQGRPKQRDQPAEARRRARLAGKLLSGALVLAAALQTGQASAKSVRELRYDYNAVWSTAVRLIRVDGRYPVEDKDKETGYILFTFPGKGTVKKCPASLEFVRGKDGDAARVRLELQIAHQPTYIEVHFLDQLERKLREERGAPEEPKPAPPPRDDKKPKGKS